MTINRARAAAISLFLLCLPLASFGQSKEEDDRRRPMPDSSYFGGSPTLREIFDRYPEAPAAPNLAPRRVNRLDCSIVALEQQAEIPVLRLLCPTEKILAPLRLVLRVTWKDKGSVPQDGLAIVAKPKSQARLMFQEATQDWRVSLDVKRDNGKTERRWITFNNVSGISIISEQ